MNANETLAHAANLSPANRLATAQAWRNAAASGSDPAYCEERARLYDGPRPTVSTHKPAPRRDRKRPVTWELVEVLDLDFDDLDITGSLATIR